MIIGITGKSGSGKHETAKIIQKNFGYKIINADKLAHQTYEPQKIPWIQIVKLFGRNILDKNNFINRKTLAEIVFSSPIKLRQLERIVLPPARRLIREEISKLKKKDAVVVAALGNKISDLTDKIILVKANNLLCLKRLLTRENTPREILIKRLSCQKEIKKPDQIIINRGNKILLETNTIKAVKKLIHFSS